MALRQTKKNKKFLETIVNKLSHAKTSVAEILESAEDGLKAYQMEKYGNEVKGRSQFVTSEVLETVEWILPTLMKLFTSSGQIAEILPRGPEDEEGASLMTKKVNYDLMSPENNGFLLLYDWCKAALLEDYAVVKFWWESGIEKEPAEWQDLTPEELDALLENPDVEIHERLMDIDSGLYDATGYLVHYYTRPRVKLCLPEEIYTDSSAITSIQESDFVAHRVKMHRNAAMKKFRLSATDLNEMVVRFQDNDWLAEQRYDNIGGTSFLYDPNDTDFVYVWECYVNDYDGNGVKVPMKVSVIGDRVVDVVENTYGRPPFAALSTFRLPHRLIGMSMAKVIGELQKLRTALMRSILDNIYYQNNGINVVNPYRINLDDVLNRKEPGAVWRTLHDIDPSSAIYPVPVTPLAPQTMQILGVTDTLVSRRSGVTTFDAEFQQSSMAHSKSLAVAQILGAAHERVEMLARLFAETGLKELITAFVDMNLKFFDAEENIKVDEGWIQVDPESIKGRYDLRVEYSAGAVGKEVRIQQMLTLLQTVLPIVQAGYEGVVTGENIYNLISNILNHMGIVSTNKYVSNPGAIDPAIAQKMQQYELMLQQAQQNIQLLQQANQQLQQQVNEAKLDKEVDILKIQQKEQESLRDAMLEEKKIELETAVDTLNIVAPQGSGKEGDQGV